MPDSPIKGNTDRITAAIAHVEQGFGAFSVWSTLADGTCKCPKGPICLSPGKHPIPRDGFKAASTDPERVRAMLSAGSDPNYGIVAPEGSDIITIDVDGADWRERMGALTATYGKLPATKTTRTPSGGLHLFYRWPAGVPLPDGDDFHGFVCRYPWRGYVVGPGSAINGAMYRQIGGDDIATLPLAWANRSTSTTVPPLIVVSEGADRYEMPESVETGHRHDEIVRLVASMWNHRVSDTVMRAAVMELSRRFVEPMDNARLKHEVDEAVRTANKKWEVPAGGTRESTTAHEGQTESSSTHSGREVIEVGLLDAPVSAPPLEMRREAFTTASQIAGLMDHWTPRTDASFEGLLITTLVYAGSLMGHNPTTFYGSREQHTNVFAALVGTTGVSRKGTTSDLVRGVWKQVTDATNDIAHSANSGEGVIVLAAKANGDPVLIVEEEFARFLAAKGRDFATLSPIMRQAFDDVTLSSTTARGTVRAAVHHVSMIAHITREELTGSFNGIDVKNGFANRIAWTGTFQRPGVVVTVHDNALPRSLNDDLQAMLAWTTAIPKPLVGGVTHQIDPVARQMLADASGSYNAGVGLAPFLSRRLDTIAARLALIYACFDHERTIAPIHVEAALAVTDYAHASAKWVWPETTGDEKADFVLRHLRVAPGGFLNNAEIRALIGHRALDVQIVADKLGDMGYARPATRPRRDGKPGKPQQGLELT